jgi:endonuclease/exonuclease/phosphatase family metal-dependent hydrolase
MRIASFNVENLFQRAKALALQDKDQARVILEQYARINDLFNQQAYSKADKAEMIDLLAKLGLADRDDGGDFTLLRQNRGRLLRRPISGGAEIIADGRSDWIGWVELKTEPVNELATQHTAMVIRDVGADIQAVVEADNRIALKKFSEIALQALDADPFEHVMLIDGNDDRGIDVALMTKTGHAIADISSHVDDTDSSGEIFSRDCPEYTVVTKGGDRIVLLVNHLKSKGFGTQSSSNAKRRRQARRVAQIYKRLIAKGEPNVVVLGDLNDTPDSNPLAPLLIQTDLRDVTEHPKFKSDGRPGTFGNGSKSQKIDYVLLSPALFNRVSGGAIFRKGVWGGKNGTLFEHYPTITRKVEAASDHAAIYADIT